MSKKRGTLLIILLLLLALILGACAFANGSDGTSAKTIDKPSLKFYGSTAMCSAAVTKTGKAIEATLELWQDRILVASWHKEDTGTVSFTESVVIPSDVSYTLILSGSVDGKEFDEQRFEYAPEGGSASPVQDADADYEYNTGKALVLARVTEKSEGPFSFGSWGLLEELKCEVLGFFGEERLKDRIRSDNAYCRFNNYTVWESLGSMVIDEKFIEERRNPPKNAYKPDGTISMLYMPIEYNIYLTWDHREKVDVGDIILAEVEIYKVQHTTETSDPDSYVLFIQPYAQDRPAPHMAKFEGGKLQIMPDLQETFNLRRIYDDTEPGSRSIKAGDTVEEVTAFIACVDQDMARYEKEHPEKVIEVSWPELNRDYEKKEASCRASVTAAGKSIEAKLELFCGDWFDGELIASWTASGKDQVSFDEIQQLTDTNIYSLRITGTADGVPFPPKVAKR